MSLLAREIGRRLCGAVALVSLALLVLFGLFDLIDQLDGGKAPSAVKALVMTGLLLPGHFYELLPVATLIGALVVMAQMATSSEYTIIRTSGVSVGGMVRLLVLPAVVLAVVGMFAGEWLAPLADRELRSLKLGGGGTIAQQMRSGYWLKDEGKFVNLGGVSEDGLMIGVTVYEFAAAGELRALRRARAARFEGDDHWLLEGVESTEFGDKGVTVVREPSRRWDTRLGPDILRVMAVAPERMSAFELWPYLEHLRNNRQETGRHETALWAKLLYPLSVVAMLLLALSFARLQGRAGSTLLPVFAGILLGIGFHFLSRVGNNLGQLNAWPPLVGAGAATLVFVVLALWLLRRVERV